MIFFNKRDFTASKSDLLSILGNMLTLSNLANVALAGENLLLVLSIISSRWLLSLILNDILPDNLKLSDTETCSIQIDKLSIAVLQ